MTRKEIEMAERLAWVLNRRKKRLKYKKYATMREIENFRGYIGDARIAGFESKYPKGFIIRQRNDPKKLLV
jgi:hypothetical protein